MPGAAGSSRPRDAAPRGSPAAPGPASALHPSTAHGRPGPGPSFRDRHPAHLRDLPAAAAWTGVSCRAPARRWGAPRPRPWPSHRRDCDAGSAGQDPARRQPTRDAGRPRPGMRGEAPTRDCGADRGARCLVLPAAAPLGGSPFTETWVGAPAHPAHAVGVAPPAQQKTAAGPRQGVG